MGRVFGLSPRGATLPYVAGRRSLAVAGAATIVAAALLAPLVGALVDSSVKGVNPLEAFLVRELVNFIAAVPALLALLALLRTRQGRALPVSALVWIAAATAAVFAVVRYPLQVAFGIVDLSESPEWLGPEIVWGLMLWPILFAVLWLISQRERIVDAQTVLLDEARRALRDDHEALRSRVFDHLHGTVTSELVVARVRLKDLARETADEELARRMDTIADHIQRIHELEVRRLAHSMVASGLDTSLEDALHELASSCEGMCAVTVRLDAEYRDLDRRIDADTRASLRLTLYRIVEECLSNALRHAHAQNVAIEIQVRPSGRASMVSVHVSSDGDVPADVPDPGVGLRVIRARVAPYDGDVQTSVQQGLFNVRVELSVAE
jgi:signal transduction histidine kinase